MLERSLIAIVENEIRDELGKVRVEVQEAYKTVNDFLIPERYKKKLFFKALKEELKIIKKELP